MERNAFFNCSSPTTSAYGQVVCVNKKWPMFA